MKKCPYCGEAIQDKARKCRFCMEWLTADEGHPNKTLNLDDTAEEKDGNSRPSETPSTRTPTKTDIERPHMGKKNLLRILAVVPVIIFFGVAGLYFSRSPLELFEAIGGLLGSSTALSLILYLVFRMTKKTAVTWSFFFLLSVPLVSTFCSTKMLVSMGTIRAVESEIGKTRGHFLGEEDFRIRKTLAIRSGKSAVIEIINYQMELRAKLQERYDTFLSGKKLDEIFFADNASISALEYSINKVMGADALLTSYISDMKLFAAAALKLFKVARVSPRAKAALIDGFHKSSAEAEIYSKEWEGVVRARYKEMITTLNFVISRHGSILYTIGTDDQMVIYGFHNDQDTDTFKGRKQIIEALSRREANIVDAYQEELQKRGDSIAGVLDNSRSE